MLNDIKRLTELYLHAKTLLPEDKSWSGFHNELVQNASKDAIGLLADANPKDSNSRYITGIAVGYTVQEPIKANIGKLREVRTSLKGTPMLGFIGTFSVNFEIPDYWGIGKSVSRGFGTVKRVSELGS
ncbi:MAG: CRISPR-associated endonuclease Cas6 [Candidatus Anammoxibacter sp.]